MMRAEKLLYQLMKIKIDDEIFQDNNTLALLQNEVNNNNELLNTVKDFEVFRYYKNDDEEFDYVICNRTEFSKDKYIKVNILRVINRIAHCQLELVDDAKNIDDTNVEDLTYDELCKKINSYETDISEIEKHLKNLCDNYNDVMQEYYEQSIEEIEENDADSIFSDLLRLTDEYNAIMDFEDDYDVYSFEDDLLDNIDSFYSEINDDYLNYIFEKLFNLIPTGDKETIEKSLEKYRY